MNKIFPKINLSYLKKLGAHQIATVGGEDPPDEAYVDHQQGVCIQVWHNATEGCKGTPWEGAIRVCVKWTTAKELKNYDKPKFQIPLLWDDLQSIKDHFWPDRIAIEIYPPQEKIVNVAALRWLWVLPPGAVLPFNLQTGSTDRLTS